MTILGICRDMLCIQSQTHLKLCSCSCTSNIVTVYIKENEENPNRSTLIYLGPFTPYHKSVLDMNCTQFSTVGLIGNDHSLLKMIDLWRIVHKSINYVL